MEKQRDAIEEEVGRLGLRPSLARGLIGIRRAEAELRRVPELTLPMRIALEAIELCNGSALSKKRLRRVDGGDYAVRSRTQVKVLRRLLRERLIEVVSLRPAVYRLTKLGRVARGLR